MRLRRPVTSTLEVTGLSFYGTNTARAGNTCMRRLIVCLAVLGYWIGIFCLFVFYTCTNLLTPDDEATEEEAIRTRQPLSPERNHRSDASPHGPNALLRSERVQRRCCCRDCDESTHHGSIRSLRS